MTSQTPTIEADAAPVEPYVGRHRAPFVTWVSPNDVEHVVPLALDGTRRPCATCGRAHDITGN